MFYWAYAAASLLAVAAALTIEIFRRSRNTKSNPRCLPPPPGPKADPLIGHARHFPAETPWIKFAEWKKPFGDILYLHALGNNIIVLNSYTAARDLLGKKSIYSDRPELPFLELVGLGRSIVLSKYNDMWRRHRKLMYTFMQKSAIEVCWTEQQNAARAYLNMLLDSPKDFSDNARLMAGKLIMSTIYGIQVESSQNQFIVYAERIMDLAKYASPGAAYVNIFPILKYVPSWFPGAKFKKEAKRLRALVESMMDHPFQRVKSDRSTGAAVSSFTSQLLEDVDANEEDIKWVTGAMYGAGVDTISESIISFILAMASYPGVQKRAQEEIDRVVGTDRLPKFEDRPSLPYVECLFKENLRWYPVTPIGAPHRVTEDDYYEGYWIPAGSTVLGNTWAMSRDESVYKDADTFSPERFESKNGEIVLDPQEFVFGFGRRSCAGLHFADASLYIAIVYILATFDISKSKDENGVEIEPKKGYAPGLVGHLEPFECSITPRSARAAALIRGE
ncbi:hypothetical protein BOTBODRAFT_172482 [Botryobasidium botryosum FD-172 SS1]|uniref:Cytochrome P450 n=1 Tax=Botryobasidium botryosum (strain FD-172 SS1) TaxID=930990 RepID=A0A067MZX8_BOTB1|nr:hypothetical protein BOTBODRAFT_172482 [Botryobasidium botryosum FD-172 SS1]